jgi:hypothetical protein
MTDPRPFIRNDFPQLADFAAGYLHQDFRAEHQTPAAARDAFLNAVSQEERRRFDLDVQRFLRATASASWTEVQQAWAALGAAWMPRDRRALERLLIVTRMPEGRAGDR